MAGLRSCKGKVATLSVLTPEDRRLSEQEARVRLIRGRREIGLSQLDLALKLSVSRDSIEDYESGRTRVPAWILISVERLLAAHRMEAA